MRRLQIPASCMGIGVQVDCPFFPAGSGVWLSASDVVTAQRLAPRPARVLVYQFASDVLDKAPRTLSDFASERTDVPTAGSRARLVARMLGLLSASTSKGFSSGRHHHLAMDDDDAEGGRSSDKKPKLVGEHLWKPFASQQGGGEGRELTAAQFTYSLEELLDPEERRTVAIRLWICIYDEKFSFSALFGRVMEENALLFRSSMASSMEETARRANLCRAQQLYSAVCDGDICTGCTLVHKQVRSLKALADLYSDLGRGASGVSAPLVDDYDSFPSPSANARLDADNAFGPCFVLNAARSPLVMTAGLIDGNGQRVHIHPEQADVMSYVQASGRFCPTGIAATRGLVHTCTDASQTSLWSLPLPASFRTGAVPSERLLSIVRELRAEASPVLREAAAQGRVEVGALQKELIAEFEGIAARRDPELLMVERALSQSESVDCIDTMRSSGSGVVATRSPDGKVPGGIQTFKPGSILSHLSSD